MNRALLGLGGFALLFALGLAWMRWRMPAPELPAIAELVPADALFYFETRRPREWLAGGGLAAEPGLSRAISSLPIDALAAALIAAGPRAEDLRALVLAESREPELLEAALRQTLASWREVGHQQGATQWVTFHRPGHPVLALYRGRATLALAAGEEPLLRLIARRRGNAPALSDLPELLRRRQQSDSSQLLWSDPHRLAPALAALAEDGAATPPWLRRLGELIAAEHPGKAGPVP